MKEFFKIFQTIWMIVATFLLVMSLVFNLLVMAGGAAYNLASIAFETVTGNQSVAARHANETKTLQKDFAHQKKLNRELKSRVTSLSGDLAALRLTTLDASTQKMVVHKGKRTSAKAAVLSTTALISKRAAATAKRSAGSVVGESIPYAGTAIIVGVTALELYDLCETIKDMNALSRAFDPSLEPNDDQATVCSMKVPTHDEVWTAAREKPAQTLAAAKEALPTMDELRSIELLDIDWEAHWDWAISQVDSLGNDGLAGMAYVWERTQSSVDNSKNDLLEWWQRDNVESD
ncbi:hypothetical protein [Ruegeria sp. HKCCA5763]|uniref:hypothetical protein n=1 Tax=Ruegeria sp. HKCCA5763 TaxID=2682987 RepID=UPI0014892274|nr:hypothetical protein [Ruegeria sp. HKCCA5763]